MKTLVGLSPINYINITSVSGKLISASAVHGASWFTYGVTFSSQSMDYSVNNGVVTVRFHLGGCSASGADFYSPTLNFSVSIAGYIL